MLQFIHVRVVCLVLCGDSEWGNWQMPILKSDVDDKAAKLLPMSAIMNRLKVDSALHKVRPR